MLDDRFSVIPGADGQLFAGSRSSAAGLNKQRWAQITASTVVNGVTLYTWQEVTPYLRTCVPMVGGMTGDALLNPAIEPNGVALTVNSFVKVRAGYFDAKYDMIYYVESSGSGGGSGISFIQQLTFNSSQMYTSSANAILIFVEVYGDGGGGGGVVAAGVGTATASQGGGGGGYNSGWRDPVADGPQVLTIGTGGSGGANTGTSGASGTGSNYGGFIVATGGDGGAGMNAAAVGPTSVGNNDQEGDFGIVFAAGAYAIGGKGTRSFGPLGGYPGIGKTNGVADNGSPPGGGGSGAAAVTGINAGAKVGGNGGAGRIIITEWS